MSDSENSIGNRDSVDEYPDEKWHGVPPAGERRAPSRYRYLAEITLVLLIEFGLWAIYRALTADFYGQFGTYWFYVGHIIAAPTIHLGPILLYWLVIRKEKLFVKSEKENGQFMSFSIGPFKMTRKLLLTAVLVGLFGGIVWRFSEMVVSDTTGLILGGATPLTFTPYDLFTGSDFFLFLLMTFVMFFIVGPVEEFQFRSFVHDQSQRVLPKWGALIYSSVFFGLSHIPIALTVYKMTFVELIFAEISWMTAGAVFGALYMWSRNIFACIVMHGIGNWQLSVYFWQSEISGTGLTDVQGYITSLSTSIFANAFLILIFFLIHKFYWEPQRNGEAAFGGLFLPIQTYFFRHDSGSKSPSVTITSLFAVSILVLTAIVGGTVVIGKKVNVDAGGSSGSSEVQFDLTDYTQIIETRSEPNELLEEGESMNYNITSTSDKVLTGFILTLTWEDETVKPGRPTIRRYTNQPDTFNISVSGSNITQYSQAANQQGLPGMIQMDVEIPSNITQMNKGEYMMDISITMVDAGIWTGLSLLGFTDPGNGYELVMEITYLESPSPEIVES
jgi:membrane protease YdiL (CAAX protease family)